MCCLACTPPLPGRPPPHPRFFSWRPHPPPGPARGLKKKGGGSPSGVSPPRRVSGKKGPAVGPPLPAARPGPRARARVGGRSRRSRLRVPRASFPPSPPSPRSRTAPLSLSPAFPWLCDAFGGQGGGGPRPRPRARGSAFLGVLPLPSSSPTLLGRCDGIRGGLGLPGGACVVVSRGPGFFLFPPAPVLAAPVSSERAAVVCGRRGRMVKGRAARGFAGSPPGRRVGGDVPSPAAVRHGQAAPWA